MFVCEEEGVCCHPTDIGQGEEASYPQRWLIGLSESTASSPSLKSSCFLHGKGTESGKPGCCYVAGAARRVRSAPPGGDMADARAQLFEKWMQLNLNSNSLKRASKPFGKKET
ncbi:unnamed protein product [Timema podura]|uniref:Uncharacterized protein n=1 Tax=Timema podura TaxID=61482 RepID=A0ABN7NDK9_TIMPD|nr:unnamed protein product [Timema podura]